MQLLADLRSDPVRRIDPGYHAWCKRIESCILELARHGLPERTIKSLLSQAANYAHTQDAPRDAILRAMRSFCDQAANDPFAEKIIHWR